MVMIMSFGERTNAYYKRMRDALIATTVDEDIRPVLSEGRGVECLDIQGHTFFDWTSQVGVNATGFCRKEVVDAICEQARLLSFVITNDYHFVTTHERGALKGFEVSPTALAEELIRISPSVPGPKKVLFEVSGATAVNAAGKLCLHAQPIAKKVFGAFEKAFHGRHGFSLDISSSKPIHKLLHESGFSVVRLPFPKRGMSVKNYGKAVRAFLDNDSRSSELNAVFMEIVQGEGGINIPEIEALDVLMHELKKRDILCVADEVQTGMGRTGKMFASDYLKQPVDMIVLSKALGGGLPLGAVITRTDILPGGNLPQAAHSGTMGACPLSVAAAMANLHVLEKEHCVKKSEQLGSYMLESLKAITAGQKCIVDVDGMGLMARVEFANKDLRNQVVYDCAHRNPGLLLVGAGEKTIRFMPPLIVTKEEIDQALAIFKQALKTPG